MSTKVFFFVSFQKKWNRHVNGVCVKSLICPVYYFDDLQEALKFETFLDGQEEKNAGDFWNIRITVSRKEIDKDEIYDFEGAKRHFMFYD